METLWRVAQSMQAAARLAGVQVVTGDTKVVDHGKGDGLFINTSGIGLIRHRQDIGPRSVRPGDAVLISGDVGRHGVAVMAVREGLGFQTTIESDSAPVSAAVAALLDNGIDVHCLRDLTRGGLASALNEIAEGAQARIEIDEARIPVLDDVHAACELLGLDPLYTACEGRFVVFCPESLAERALALLAAVPCSSGAARIGRVRSGGPLVTMTSRIGAERIVSMLSGEQLPRIC
jgi:hydrogenase expression/formation protein HypE